jgi:uncharacterized protein (DUF305 family)
MPNAHRTWLFSLVVALTVVGCKAAPPNQPTTPPPTSTMPPAPAASPNVDPTDAEPTDQEADAPDPLPDATNPVDPNIVQDTPDPTASPEPTGLNQAPAVAAGTTDERIFIDGVILALLGDLKMLDDAAARAQRDEIKQYVAKTKPLVSAQLSKLRIWRKGWFGSSSATGTITVDTDMLPDGSDYDWSWADEMTRRIQPGIDFATKASTGNVRDEVKTFAADIIKGWTADRDQLDAWVDAWLAAWQSQQPPADGTTPPASN